VTEVGDNKETSPEKIVFDNGDLQPLSERDIFIAGKDYKHRYTVAVPTGDDGREQRTYYLKPSSEGSQEGTVSSTVPTWPVKGDMWNIRDKFTGTLPKGVTYALEQGVNQEGTPKDILTLNFPSQNPGQ